MKLTLHKNAGMFLGESVSEHRRRHAIYSEQLLHDQLAVDKALADMGEILKTANENLVALAASNHKALAEQKQEFIELIKQKLAYQESEIKRMEQGFFNASTRDIFKHKIKILKELLIDLGEG